MNLLILYHYNLFQFLFNLKVFYEQLHELDEILILKMHLGVVILNNVMWVYLLDHINLYLIIIIIILVITI